MKHKQQFFVEGNIGVGKSTFLRIVEETLDCQMVFEPHEKWQDINGAGNLLHHFYADTQRWAYTFQSYAFMTRVMEQDLQAAKRPGTVQVVERSVFSDRYCFAQLATEAGNMNKLEWQVYQHWFDWLVGAHMEKPAGCIYLRTTPETCLKRLKKRARSEETGVALEYLTALHNKHEDWLLRNTDVPVLVLDCDIDFEHDENRQAELIKQITDTFGPALRTIPRVSAFHKYDST
jgi:deoxyadenosine/deoxycytidine kinase